MSNRVGVDETLRRDGARRDRRSTERGRQHRHGLAVGLTIGTVIIAAAAAVGTTLLIRRMRR
ncbi:hypothetical protein ITJ57_00360 [Plantibacter sp. VKM Ac-2880]|uniref:hypothetical protein n=1 Tax=Plantibacter sp. VKM Ac-2880 TaxID=2783827 RepID=UPI0018902403|nr:hypothetical protein [Plantibacter sp. VKM Ac-2880]MBF4567203.1 hypothetical protein [Plantibacter sp. VKM Ac-2880]